ncbi:DUF1287 domain-containing protein [Chamaesiphon polymorphus]|uniref:DUF1287 domain-containing protein n=1 Tax=Chamaesiphon polymorphus CCALA 037 TaxID=2107692 RepID=A0A2T1FH31_9CYAN|nr:DUF1287 domain-containing protein [Chamaesiphon polymorphus]PSB44302.1 DUF1287 domain-containing protein [Chamaesiphon polymorphus CCALA 037]
MNRRSSSGILALFSALLLVSCNKQFTQLTTPTSTIVPIQSPKIQQILDNAIAQTKITRSYDPAYVKLAYPGGDVPMTTGVCTDVIIRAFRAVKIDLQAEVHRDMQRNFAAYPRNWGAKAPDANIDHRRVPNLMTWLQRRGKAVPITNNGRDYQPGDIVTWGFSDGQQHIGIVSNIRVAPDRLAIVHNVGSGTKVEDVLFVWKQIGHYRYF